MMAMQQARLASWVSGGMVEPHADVVTQIQADFTRLFCRPQIAKNILSADGATLDESTLQKIHQVDDI
jgi:hypothetical protein